jgi:hypothetical protein
MDPSNSRLEDTVAAMAGKMWPSPAARDLKGANGTEHLTNGTGRLHLDQLPNFVAHLWSTPRASDGEKGGPNMSFGAGGAPLPAMAASWMTPRVATGKYTRDTGQKGKERPTIDGQACRFSLPPQEPLPPGTTPLQQRRTLNPQFVSWLMGWPPGWIAFACSEMELFRWKQRMRSALSSFASPREAPPAQLSLAV